MVSDALIQVTPANTETPWSICMNRILYEQLSFEYWSNIKSEIKGREYTLITYNGQTKV